MPETRRIFVGLGSNTQRELNLRSALLRLAAAFGPLQTSPVYESADSRFHGPAFYNLVAGFDSDVSPLQLRQCFREIEADCGRTARREQVFPLDLDLLLCGDERHLDPLVPHPDVLSAAFVLKPLCDLVPDYVHPDSGQTLAAHWQAMAVSAGLRRLGLRF